MDLIKIAQLVEKSNAEHKHIGMLLLRGFVPSKTEDIVATIKLLHSIAPGRTFLDLGCGTGGWLLIAAAAGFPSYGIESNPLMLKACRRNLALAREQGLIDPKVDCVIVQGNMIPDAYSSEYQQFVAAHQQQGVVMPITGKDPYASLPVSIRTADIVCTWAWSTQSRILFGILGKEAKQDALFVLPSYASYMKENEGHMIDPLHLRQVAQIGKVFVGKR